MRGIKFRAWDKTTEEMLQVKALILAENTLLGCGGKPHIFDEHNDLHPLNEVALMQYTGLKDKNGKEIYEGDIAILPDRWPKFPVRYIDGMFCLEGTSWPLHEYYEECEIIGNIYENPELL